MGLHVIKFIDWACDDLKGLYADCLNLIFHWGELDLSNIGFAGMMITEWEVHTNKVKLANDYQYLLYRTLFMCIEKMNRKSVDFYSQKFITYFIALAYFRVPVFKDAFVKCVHIIFWLYLRTKLVRIWVRIRPQRPLACCKMIHFYSRSLNNNSRNIVTF